MAIKVLTDTSLSDIPLIWKGKVRDVYAIDDQLLIVTTDRVSAFDVILPNGIPDKGRVLNQISLFWFSKTADVVPNHVVTAEVKDYPPSAAPFADQLEGRSILAQHLTPIPFECVVRGYLYGSGLKEYQQKASVCGIPLPEGLRMADAFSEPLFTPATKEQSGHDINVSEAFMDKKLGGGLTSRLKEISLELYCRGRDEAARKGIIIADTKFEFGLDADERIVLIDEVLTPDSSRFWPNASYEPGREQPSYDKQYIREYLETLDWDKTPPGPELPAAVVEGTRDRYREAYRTLTGQELP